MLVPPAEPGPLAGHAVGVTGSAAALGPAALLLASLGARIVSPAGEGAQLTAGAGDQAERIEVRVSPNSAATDWALSGAMALTGPADGPPALAPGAPASAMNGALAAFELLSRIRAAPARPLRQAPGHGRADSGLLGERAALTGMSRQAPRSVGGAFRALRATDGWLGLSLARPDDIDLLPALAGGDLHADDLARDPWPAVAAWITRRELAATAARARLIGLAAAPVPDGPVPARRPPVLSTPGGPRPPVRSRPLVVDLTSLWAGPLCAHLLGLTGACVVKVESRDRPDGARAGSPAFFDLLHAGHLSVALDLGAPGDIAALRRLLARADVILEASRPRALRQLGVDADEYVAAGTVWASITAYGRAGEDAHQIGYGDDVAAAAGLVAWCDKTPYPVGDAIADPLAGAYAAAAVAAALLSPGGHLLDVSMYDVAIAAAGSPGPAAEVVASGDRTWTVHTADGITPVCQPRGRQPHSAAARLGQHTRAVMDRIR